MNEEFVKEFLNDKTKAIDIAYENTAKSLGMHHTRCALKFILLNDKEAIEDMNEIEDKYLYISSKNGGRALIKLFDEVDIYQILVRFVISYYGLKYKDNKIINEIIKLVLNDHYQTYMYLKVKKDLTLSLFDLFIEYRYKRNKKFALDSFDGGCNKKLKNQFDLLNDCYKEIRNSV